MCFYFNKVFYYSIRKPPAMCQPMCSHKKRQRQKKKKDRGDWLPQNNQPLVLLSIQFVLTDKIVHLHIFNLHIITTRPENSA